jgi:hypothetical protein
MRLIARQCFVSGRSLPTLYAFIGCAASQSRACVGAAFASPERMVPARYARPIHLKPHFLVLVFPTLRLEKSNAPRCWPIPMKY